MRLTIIRTGQLLIALLLLLPLLGEAKAQHAKPTASTDKFIASLLPEIKNINSDIMAERKQLLALEEKHDKKQKLSAKELAFLNNLSTHYKLNSTDFSKASTWRTLESRVDIIPPSLALAQAATESGWGKSRFAKQGNNLFGQSCFSRGCGIPPKTKARPKYEAQKFESITAAVRSYAKNLNTHAAYEKLRQLRYDARQKEEHPKGLTMAKGLVRYSERGDGYIRMINTMIHKYHLEQFDKTTLTV